MKFKFLVALLASVVAWSATANLSLTNVSEAELEKVINDFSAVFNHTTVSPASSLGAVFGMEFGLIGGTASTPGVDAVAQSAGESVADLPTFGLFGMISVPMGFTIEGSFLPSLDLGDGKFSNVGVAGKWTITDTPLLDLPVDLALKLSVNTSELSFNQAVSSVDTKTTFKDTITTFSAYASKSFAVVEPYVGFGYVKADGELSVEGSNTIFDFTSATSAKASPSGSMFVVGAQFNLLLMRLAVETGKILDSNRTTAKFSFYF